jgi:hypothetical protein
MKYMGIYKTDTYENEINEGIENTHINTQYIIHMGK